MEKKIMTRPAVWIGFTYFATLLVATFLGITVTPLLLGAALLVLVALIVYQVKYKADPTALILCVTVVLGLSVFNVLSAYTVLPPQRYAGTAHRVEGELLSEGSHRYENFLYTFRVTAVDGKAEATPFSVRLSHGFALPAEIGDTVTCDVRFNNFEDAFGLSSRTAQLADGKTLSAYIRDYTTVKIQKATARPIAYYLAAIRSAVRDAIYTAFPAEEASVLSAMLIGDRDGISDALNRSYRDAGASHILVVSGMHMAIIAQFMLGALRFLGLRRRGAPLVTMVFVLAFMLLSGLSETVVRSGIMQLIFLFGLVIGRTPDAVNSLAVAMLVILLINPFSVGDISLLLSFSATLGILLLQPRLASLLTKRIENEKRRRRALQVLSPLTTAVAAIGGSLPVQLYVFGTINFSSVLSSLLVLYISAWLIRIGLLAVFCLVLPGLQPAALPFVLVSGLLARLQNALVRLVAEYLPAKLSLYGAYLAPAVLFGVLLLGAAFALRCKRSQKITAGVMTACLFLSGMAVQAAENSGARRIALYNSDFAECAAVVENGDAVILYCSGNDTDISDYLHTLGVSRISLLHVFGEESAVRCAEGLAAEFPTARAVCSADVYFPLVVGDTYDYALTVSLSETNSFSVTAGGRLSSLTVGGETIAFEHGRAQVVGEAADVLITSRTDTKIDARFTLLETDGIIEEMAGTLASGDYVLTGARETILATRRDDGAYAVFGG